MGWIVVALGAAATGGAVSIIDKVVLHRHVRSHVTFQLMVGLVQAAIGIALLALTGWLRGAAGAEVILSLSSGALWGAGALILFRVLSTHEVSRTIPVYQTFPVYAALMGAAFLGESLAPLQWLAVCLTVAGAALLSLSRGAGGVRGVVLHRVFFLLSVGAMIAAGAYVCGSAAAAELPVLTVHGLRSVAMGAVLVSASLRRRAFTEVRTLVAGRSPAGPLVLVNESIASVSLGMTVWALALGPVALVTALMTTRSFFVLGYSVLLGLAFRDLLGERVTAGAVAVKAVAVALVVGGLVLISVA